MLEHLEDEKKKKKKKKDGTFERTRSGIHGASSNRMRTDLISNERCGEIAKCSSRDFQSRAHVLSDAQIPPRQLLLRRYRCGLAGLREYFRLPERSPPLEESSSVIIEHPASARREPVSGKPRASRCSNLRVQDNGERYTCCVFYVARTCRAARLARAASRPDSGLEYSLCGLYRVRAEIRYTAWETQSIARSAFRRRAVYFGGSNESCIQLPSANNLLSVSFRSGLRLSAPRSATSRGQTNDPDFHKRTFVRTLLP